MVTVFAIVAGLFTKVSLSYACGVTTEPAISSFYSELNTNQTTVRFYYEVSSASSDRCGNPLNIFLKDVPNQAPSILIIQKDGAWTGAIHGWTDLYDISSLANGTYWVTLQAQASVAVSAIEWASFTINNRAAPSGTLSATSCEIASNASTCNSSVTWTTANRIPGADTAVTRNNPANTTVSTSTSGTNVSNNVNYGSSSFYLYHNAVQLASTDITASCVAGTSWNGSSCQPTTCNNGATNPPACNVFPPPPPPGAVNGACSSPQAHFSCSVGSDSNHGADNTKWTWQCDGINNGASASCQEIKPNGPLPTNGVCAATHWNCSAGNDTTHNTSVSQYTWICEGTNNGTNDSCSEAIIIPPGPTPGSCAATHWDCSSPAGSTDHSTSSSAWTWTCPGSNNGTNASCEQARCADPAANNTGEALPCTYTPVDGHWSAWGACSETICGRTGTQTRTCTPEQYGGTPCSSIDGGNNTQACSTPACPTGTISCTSCTIPGGSSTCNSFVTWNTQNLTAGVTEVTRNNPRNTHVSYNTSDTNFLNIVNFNASTFFLYHNLYGIPTVLNSCNMNASCSAGTIWDGRVCKAVPGGLSGTLITNPSSCNILNGESACTTNKINITWETLNPLDGSVSAVTSNRLANFIVADKNTNPPSGYSGSVNFAVKHGVETLYLYNNKNARPLAENTVAGVCAPGTAWDLGSKTCKTIPATHCGNGIVENGQGGTPDYGEQCDDGNQYNGQCPSPCSIACTLRSCLAPGDIEINVHSNVIFQGESATLSWAWDGEESCSGVNFNTGGATTGSLVVHPNSTTTYTINCGTETAQATLTVKKKPIFNEN